MYRWMKKLCIIFIIVQVVRTTTCLLLQKEDIYLHHQTSVIVDEVYVKDELELVKYIQQYIHKKSFVLKYKSQYEMDMDTIIHDLSLLNPFDLTIHQSMYQQDQEIIYLLKVERITPSYEKSVKKAKSIISNLIQPQMSTREKIISIHDYIIQNCVYALEEKKAHIFQAEGVFFKKEAVCSGYARAFMMLCQEANIPTIYVASETMNHAWNYVYDGKQWLYIDVTWDDPLPNNDRIILQTHALKEEKEWYQHLNYKLTEEEYRKLQRLKNAYFYINTNRE